MGNPLGIELLGHFLYGCGVQASLERFVVGGANEPDEKREHTDCDGSTYQEISFLENSSAPPELLTLPNCVV
jgi:hypothetical protein